MTGSPPAAAPAGLARRFAALGYEALLLGAVLFFAGLAFLPLARDPTAGIARPAFQLYLFAVWGGYSVWLWSNGRRTLAMKTWRIRLLAPDGRPPRPGRALARFAAAWIGPVLGLLAYGLMGRIGLVLVGFNFAWALVDRDRRFLHDRLAGTRLVRESASPHAAKPG